MENRHSAGGHAVACRHVNHLIDQLSAHMIRQRVSEDFLRAAVQHCGQVHKPHPSTDTGNIPTPLDPRSGPSEVTTHHVRELVHVLGPHGGADLRPRLCGPQPQLPHDRPDRIHVRLRPLPVQCGGNAPTKTFSTSKLSSWRRTAVADSGLLSQPVVPGLGDPRPPAHPGDWTVALLTADQPKPRPHGCTVRKQGRRFLARTNRSIRSSQFSARSRASPCASDSLFCSWTSAFCFLYLATQLPTV